MNCLQEIDTTNSFLIEEIKRQNINNTTKKLKISILGSMIKKYDETFKNYDEFKYFFIIIL